jgi:hypothetical protein
MLGIVVISVSVCFMDYSIVNNIPGSCHLSTS